jgi:hypothetical protein
MFEWKVGSRHAWWLTAVIVAIVGFAACRGGRSVTAPAPRLAPLAPPAPAAASRTMQSVPGNAGSAANVTPQNTQTA